MSYTLGLDHQGALDVRALNHRTQTLQPPEDFPISVTSEGRVLSRYQDDVWDLTPYATTATRMRFLPLVDGASAAVSIRNVGLQKRVAFWSLYGMGVRCSVNSVLGLFHVFRKIIALCTRNGVLASELFRYPAVYEQLATCIPISQKQVFRRLMSRLSRDADLLDFRVLHEAQSEEIARQMGPYRQVQTAFIPERIYFYIINRCTEVVEMYLQHQEPIAELYKECVKAAIDFPSRRNKRTGPWRGRRASSTSRNTALECVTGRSFLEHAMKLGIKDVLEKTLSRNLHKTTGVRTIGTYLKSVSLACRLLLAALSGMRRTEHGTLHTDCLERRTDALLGEVLLVRGETTKTLRDKSTYWITSAPADRAIEAAKSVSSLRRYGLRKDPRRSPPAKGPTLLFPWCTDPWTRLLGEDTRSVNAAAVSSSTLSRDMLNMLDTEQLRMTTQDVAQAMRLTPDLDTAVFYEGAIWRLSWHQFRRTLVCLALGAGVSLPSLAWQLKHCGVAMTQHYGTNYFNVPADRALRREFEMAQIELLLVRGLELTKDDYVSAVGKKQVAVHLLSENDERSLVKAAKAGALAFKRTALGVCTNPDPCTYGGWEDVSHCADCTKALVDRNNKVAIKAFLNVVEADLEACRAADVVLRGSLEAQRDAALKALNAISSPD
ncbi:hypothetical protein QMO14_09490 [Variovorax sp. CAN2819]|uniref:hypothetical protein n=1 Tax=Variovorax sp. CAN15 TaxID=3046727 RepID=UPI002648112D|nr:hypothetical protein [Variovorax sp. CAN15]MDN6883827.1 hypothetical protein [Variovorax sp. CAN15]